MGETKRILVSLPQSLLEEVDVLAAMENRNRSEFIREAMKLYIREKKKNSNTREHEKGIS